MALAPLFFRRAVGAFLVYDVTSMESFEAIDRWYEQILKNIDTRVIVMLLGNKKDLPNREVPYNTAMEYCMKRNFGLMEVSAKSGNGVKEAFNRLVSEIYKFQMLEITNLANNLNGNPEVRKSSILLSRPLEEAAAD
mmetsp:Transcript_31611/g.22895  ORF Transcript_31611/g.22895 Transcript_31611/m.22895 type:complete len:137 (-) Transcript_31611:29-439(-)